MLAIEIESAGKALLSAVLVAVLFIALSMVVNYDKCENLQDNDWYGQCHGVVQTTEWGVETIETALDIQPWVKQAKHLSVTP